MAEPGEAVSRELEVVDEGEPLLCARRLAQALPVLTWSARRAAIVDATGPASPRQLMRDRRCEDDARGWESVSIRLRTLLFTRPGLFASPSLVPPSFVDRSSRDVAEAGTRTVALRSSSLSLLLLPHLARSVFNGSFALPRLLYSLDTRPSPLEHHAPPLAPPPLLHPSRPAPRPARPRPILNRQHPRLLQDLLRLHPHAVRRYQAGRGGIVACLSNPADAAKGQQQWDAACSYAASTSSMWDQAHSSAAVKVATVPGTTVLPLVTSTAARSALSTATAVAQSDTVHLASSSTSGAAKLVCTSLFALIGAVILAIVVFLEAGPSL
ncbi:hypothetical protein NBRC10512_000301 [Rhodotorula toruloides]